MLTIHKLESISQFIRARPDLFSAEDEDDDADILIDEDILVAINTPWVSNNQAMYCDKIIGVSLDAATQAAKKPKEICIAHFKKTCCLHVKFLFL